MMAPLEAVVGGCCHHLVDAELHVCFVKSVKLRNRVEAGAATESRHVVARGRCLVSNAQPATTDAAAPLALDYACEMLELVERMVEAVEAAVVDEQHTTASSRKADSLAARAPGKMQKLAEKAAAVARHDAEALAHLLERDSYETALQDAFDAAMSLLQSSVQWLSFGALKRGYAMSLTLFFQGHASLALKYATRLEEAFARCEAVLADLDALRARLPMTARLVRFASSDDVCALGAAACSRTLLSPQSSSLSTGPSFYDSKRYTAHEADDFLTDAAPLGVDVDQSDVFVCRDALGAVFLTSDPSVADEVRWVPALPKASSSSSTHPAASLTETRTSTTTHHGDFAHGDDDDDDSRPAARAESLSFFESPPRHHVLEQHQREQQHPPPPPQRENTLSKSGAQHACADGSARRDQRLATAGEIVVEGRFSEINEVRASSCGDGRTSSASLASVTLDDAPGVLAITTIYKTVEKARALALERADEIWSVAIDDRPYFFCVTEDGADRGLRDALTLAGVSDAAFLELRLAFELVE